MSQRTENFMNQAILHRTLFTLNSEAESFHFFFLSPKTANNLICQPFVVHFVGIRTIHIPPGRKLQFIHTENTEFTTNIYTTFQWRPEWRCRSSSFLSTTATGKFSRGKLISDEFQRMNQVNPVANKYNPSDLGNVLNFI